MTRVLTIDIGNTAAKGSVFEQDRLLMTMICDNHDADSLIRMAEEYGCEGAVFCNVAGRDHEFGERLRKSLGRPVLELTSETPLPIDVEYATPQTLGVDRIAAAAGAVYKYGGNVLVVDAGTAVTLDLVSEGRFMGGNISPGLRLRFRSLNRFTARLPLVWPDGEMPERGRDTETAIRCGVVGGLVSEIAGEYNETKKKYQDIRLIMTGGDADFLLPMLAERGVEGEIDHELVGLGLVTIYYYNRQ
ncbi:MAG: type III pantothenate kinase [Muribaculaceae bacterium]|nr:type III pantothenate kinase [Muribaculaceae bacterium]